MMLPVGNRVLASVIVPTFREATNLTTLVPLVAETLQRAGISHEIIIVDDNSRDGTDEVIAGLAPRIAVKLLVRTHERGLGSAVVHGFAHACGEVLVCMDADLSHPPSAVPDLVRAIADGGADFAIGSRYIAGGSIDPSWSRFRRLNSQVARWMARPLARVRDPGSGFFALRRDAFESVAEILNPRGFKIGLELLVKTSPRRCTEIPIHFQDRREGQSKMRLRQQMEYLWHLAQLAAFRIGRLVKRSAVSCEL